MPGVAELEVKMETIEVNKDDWARDSAKTVNEEPGRIEFEVVILFGLETNEGNRVELESWMLKVFWLLAELFVFKN
jgi:hypothetical protein